MKQLENGDRSMTPRIPKSSQFLFFLMPDETAIVLNFIASQNCGIYLEKCVTPEPLDCGISCDQGLVLFSPRQLSNRITTCKVSETLYTIDRTTSPAIEFSRPYQRANSVSRGRFYFHRGYDGREEWVAYPDILYSTYKMVVAFMKKTLLTKQKEYGGYVSKGCIRYIANGGRLDQF
jgi:hypothetical protein